MPADSQADLVRLESIYGHAKAGEKFLTASNVLPPSFQALEITRKIR